MLFVSYTHRGDGEFHRVSKISRVHFSQIFYRTFFAKSCQIWDTLVGMDILFVKLKSRCSSLTRGKELQNDKRTNNGFTLVFIELGE